jgi:hypothetical protein
MEHKTQEILPEDIWNKEKSEAIVQFVLEKRQKELDDFAIVFEYWMFRESFNKEIDWGKTTEELLKIYKKEKGL